MCPCSYLKITTFPFIFPKTVFQIITAVFHQFLSFCWIIRFSKHVSVFQLKPPSLDFTSLFNYCHISAIIHSKTPQGFLQSLSPFLRFLYSPQVPAVALSSRSLEMALTKVLSDFHLVKSNGEFSVANLLEPSPVFEDYILFEIFYSLFF